MKAARFQDLEVWKEARKLAGVIYNITASHTFEHDWTLRDQLRRAAISAMANIAEGFGRNSSREFARYLVISLGSINELQSHLYLALDLKYITKEQFEFHNQMSESVARQLAGFIKYLKVKEV